MAPLPFSLIQDSFYGLIAGVVIFIFSVLKAIQGFQRWKFSRRHGCQAPVHSVSHGLFGIGMILEMVNAGREHNFVELVRSWHRSYGDTFKARLATRNVIFTVEPRNIQAVLALKFKDFGLGEIRKAAVRPVFGEGIFTVDGSKWEHSRALLRPNFSRAQITDTKIYESHVAALLRLIPRDGSTVQLQDLFFRQTLDTASEFLFGESVHSLREETSAEAASFAKNFNVAQEGTAIRFRLGPLMKFYRNKEYTKATIEVRDFVGRFVQKAIDYRIAVNKGEKVDPEIKKLTDNQYIFAYELSKQTLDKKEITDQLLSILLAGRDTTANLLGTTFFMLARRPDIWKRLRAEVLALDGRKPSFEELRAMTYMSWIFNESLRLYPIVPFNLRCALKDTFLPVGGGPDGKSPVFVPKGDEVIYNIYTMQRDTEIYGADADEYRPERWENLRPGWAYLPFNGGPRICIGQQFALTEAGYTTVRIMQEFERIENRDSSPWIEEYQLTMSNANGTLVSMTPAQN